VNRVVALVLAAFGICARALATGQLPAAAVLAAVIAVTAAGVIILAVAAARWLGPESNSKAIFEFWGRCLFGYASGYARQAA
jgi:hypothetical protein